MFSTVNYFQTCKAGRVKLIVVFNTNYCETFESLHHLNFNFKGDIGCNISSFAYKCVFAVCERNHPTLVKMHSVLIPQKPKQSQLSRHFDFVLNNQRSLHPQYHDWGETLEQGTEPPSAPWAPQHKRLPTAPGVCSRCVCVHCFVCALGWVKCRAQIPSMGHHTWPHSLHFN